MLEVNLPKRMRRKVVVELVPCVVLPIEVITHLCCRRRRRRRHQCAKSSLTMRQVQPNHSSIYVFAFHILSLTLLYNKFSHKHNMVKPHTRDSNTLHCSACGWGMLGCSLCTVSTSLDVSVTIQRWAELDRWNL